MELKDRLARLVALLDKHPEIEREAKLVPLAAKLSKAIVDFLAKAEASVYGNSAEYPELIGLITNKELNTVVTLDWLNTRAPAGKKLAKATKKEKEQFAIEMVKTGRAGELIREIKDTPRRQMENEMSAMVLSDDAAVAAKIKAMKPAQMRQLCEHYGIPVVNNAKGAVDKKKTQPNLLKKLNEFREHAKLTKL